MTPSNANTSGLEAEKRLKQIAAAIEFGSGNGISFREEGAVSLAADIRAVIVTAASAQARIAELEADVAALIRRRDDLLDTTNQYQARYRAAEARADRLAQGMPDLSSVIGWLANGCDPAHAVDELRIYQARVKAALQQEG